MRILSGVIDQYVYFVAVDATDFTTRETGFSSFTVYRSRNGEVAAAMTTPTINETDVTNMPGVYELLLDEDMDIDAGDDDQEMVFHITHAGMAPVTRAITLSRPKVTAGETATVSGGLVALLVATQASIDAIEADTNELQVDDTPAAIAALNNISAANVNTEVVDVLKTDTLTATPQGAPATTPTFETAVMVLYDALVHAVDVTATSKTFNNNAGTVIWKKALSDDATTYTEAESVTGP